MSKQPSSLIQPLAPKEGLRDSVVRHLLVAIFSGQIKSGDRLVAQTLANQLGVSATPVREGLVELASIGLIEILSNRGAVCLPFGTVELREIYQIRRILEMEATQLASGKLPVDELQRIRNELAKIAERKTSAWSKQAMDLDEQLHHLIAVHCGNSRLLHEIDRYRDMMQALREVAQDKRRVQSTAIEQHIEIIDLLLARKAKKAGQAMGEHIDTTAKGVEQVMFGKNS